jgi:hypothetical protein
VPIDLFGLGFEQNFLFVVAEAVPIEAIFVGRGENRLYALAIYDIIFDNFVFFGASIVLPIGFEVETRHILGAKKIICPDIIESNTFFWRLRLRLHGKEASREKE